MTLVETLTKISRSNLFGVETLSLDEVLENCLRIEIVYNRLWRNQVPWIKINWTRCKYKNILIPKDLHGWKRTVEDTGVGRQKTEGGRNLCSWEGFDEDLDTGGRVISLMERGTLGGDVTRWWVSGMKSFSGTHYHFGWVTSGSSPNTHTEVYVLRT